MRMFFHYCDLYRHILQLGIFDILGDKVYTFDEICRKVTGMPNEEALLRTLRLLVTVGILHEHVDEADYEVTFGLSHTGVLLQTNRNESTTMALFVSHWTEPAMWNAWSVLPDYVAGKVDVNPFQVANDNQTLVEYYNTNPKSRQYRNDVARIVSYGEITAVLTGYDWNWLTNKTVVDIGGEYGDMMSALYKHFPDIHCKCLDLPEVIVEAKPLDGIQLVPGKMFDISTIPSCDVIFMKHVLCDWSDEDAVKILQNCTIARRKDDSC